MPKQKMTLDKLARMMNKQFGRVDKRFDEQDKKFVSIDKRFDLVDKDIGDLRKEFNGLRKDFNDLQTSVDAYSRKADTYFQEMVMLSKKVDRQETFSHDWQDHRYRCLDWWHRGDSGNTLRTTGRCSRYRDIPAHPRGIQCSVCETNG